MPPPGLMKKLLPALGPVSGMKRFWLDEPKQFSESLLAPATIVPQAE